MMPPTRVCCATVKLTVVGAGGGRDEDGEGQRRRQPGAARADDVWETHDGWMHTRQRVPEPPSTYYHDHVFGCFFRDNHGLKSIYEVGDQLPGLNVPALIMVGCVALATVLVPVGVLALRAPLLPPLSPRRRPPGRRCGRWGRSGRG